MVDRHSWTVVGVDGSPESVAAVRWAVDAGRGRARSLRLVHAVAPPPPGFPAFGYPTDYCRCRCGTAVCYCGGWRTKCARHTRTSG